MAETKTVKKKKTKKTTTKTKKKATKKKIVKKTAKKKAAKTADETLTAAQLYEQFMDAADRFDTVKTTKSKKKWCATAEELHEQIMTDKKAFTAAKLKRIGRTIEYMRDTMAAA